MKVCIGVIFSLVSFMVYAQKSANQKSAPNFTELYSEVKEVDPGSSTQAPSDAIVLFDGSDLDSWHSHAFGSPISIEKCEEYISKISNGVQLKDAGWKIENIELVVEPGTGAIFSKQHFGDVQLHLEWLAPKSEGKKGQQYSNSGVFLMGLYEIQILNSYKNQTYNNGQAASIYKQRAPLVNSSKPPGEWQEYDIIFKAPRFSEKGNLLDPARITLLHNGVLVQYNTPLNGPTVYIGASQYVLHASKMPLMIQDHGDQIRFRNIWVREL